MGTLLTIPLMIDFLTSSWQLSNSLTFSGFPEKRSSCDKFLMNTKQKLSHMEEHDKECNNTDFKNQKHDTTEMEQIQSAEFLYGNSADWICSISASISCASISISEFTRVHFLTPVNSGVKKCTRVHGPSTQPMNSGSGNWAKAVAHHSCVISRQYRKHQRSNYHGKRPLIRCPSED